jgi:hypothetical protein
MREFIPEYAPGINVTKKTRVKAGGTLVTLGDSIYAFKGGNTNEFWVYDIASDTWYYKRPIVTENGKKIKGGGALTVMGCTLYCFTGGNTYNFYSYIPELDTWIKKRDAIFGSFKTFKRKIKDGAGLVELNRKIYALKGGNTKDFGFYNLVTDTWYTLDTIYGTKRIKAGGALVAKGCSLYAFKGANTNEFWRYTPSVSLVARVENASYQAVQNNINPNLIQTQNFNITVNPITKTLSIQYNVLDHGLVTIKLYNTDGRLVQPILDDIQQPGNQTIRTTTEKLSAGVYFIRYKDNAVETNHKIIIR